MATLAPSSAPRHRMLRRDEAAALVVALALHAGLVVWLAMKPPTPAPLPLPQRMTVTFSDQIADKSTSPEPNAQAAPAIAPVVSANPLPEPAPEPKPQPAPQPQVQPQPQPRPIPRVVPAPQPKPAPAPVPQPRPQPQKPAPKQAHTPPAKPAPAKPATAKPAGGGGSRIGSDFLKGIAGGQTPGAKAHAQPAQAIGQATKSALAGAVARQLKPNWNGPSGVDVDKLATTVEWDLNPDGTLAGSPRVVGQTGQNDSNHAQAELHKEQAIRAIRLTRFDLPSEYYSAWKHLRFTFDWKIGQ